MSVHEGIALAYAAICLCVICFQVAIILGAPLGPVTQGGRHPGTLPLPNRIMAGASIFILGGLALAVVSAAGLWPRWPSWAGWAALAVQAIVTLLNWITPSRAERRLWAPITSAMLALAAVAVALG